MTARFFFGFLWNFGRGRWLSPGIGVTAQGNMDDSNGGSGSIPLLHTQEYIFFSFYYRFLYIICPSLGYPVRLLLIFSGPAAPT